MANILVLSLVFPPDNVSTAHIMGNLAADLKRTGHNVRVITTTPHYNVDLQAELRQPLRKTAMPAFRRSELHGIPVLHIAMPRKSKRVIRRLAAWSAFHVLSTLAALAGEKPDVIITPSPPLTIGISAWIIARIRRAKFIYNVQEIYPDIAINLGVLRSRWIIAAARALEQFVYARAAIVTVIAPRMLRRLLERGVPEWKLELIPNFVDTTDLQPLPKDNDFAREIGVGDKFVVNYSGNIGPAQGLETVLAAAELLRDRTDVHFVITGDGILVENIRAELQRLAVSNVTILPYQPFSRMSQIYSAADICIVPQATATGFDAVPSKVYRIMACARAVVAISHPESDLSRVVAEAACGATTLPGDSEKLAEILDGATRNRDVWRDMGRRGYNYVTATNARETITKRYAELVDRLVASR